METEKPSAETPTAPERKDATGQMGLKPYYQDSAVTIYHGDARVIMPQLSSFDLLLTDPPYGIGADKNLRANKQHGRALAPSRDYGVESWDSNPVEEWSMSLARQLCRWQIIFGGNYYDLPPSKCWLVWDKENGDNGYADCELAWTNLDKAVRRIKHQWHGMFRKDDEERFHPTQKPLDVVAWALRQAPPGVKTVLDPWMGSGTSLRAAKDAGKQAVGVEREERHCETAALRMEQEVMDFGASSICPPTVAEQTPALFPDN